MACVGHQSAGLWRHPEDQGYRYTHLDHWLQLARTLDEGGFDALFLADVLGVYDVYGGSRDAAVASASQVPVDDPTLAISAMAAVTQHLGFAVTVSLTFEQPYALARRLTTLDHLTGGRVAWNVVTSYLESAARNLGHDGHIPHDERYEMAEEYLEVCYKLWEASWEDGAVVRGAVRGDPRGGGVRVGPDATGRPAVGGRDPGRGRRAGPGSADDQGVRDADADRRGDVRRRGGEARGLPAAGERARGVRAVRRLDRGRPRRAGRRRAAHVLGPRREPLRPGLVH